MLKGVRKQTYNATAYVPGKSIDAVMQDYNLTSIVKLGSNENNYSPFPAALKAMQEELLRTNVYPEKNYVRLKRLLGAMYSLSEEWIGLGHGAGNVLDTLAKTFLEDGDEVIIPKQSYGLYKEISWIMGATVKFVDLNDDFKIELNEIERNITEKTKLIWLCNPNNPTGTIFDKSNFEEFLKKLPEHTWVVLDEAYVEFADPKAVPETIELIKKGYNLMSVRTFSKLFGLAGQRIGYVIATPELISCYDTVSEPFNANRIGLAAAVATLENDIEHIEKCKNCMISDRKMMNEELEKLGCKTIETHTNFIFFELPCCNAEVNELLLRDGVIVRPATGWGYPNHLRVSIGTTEENLRFIEAIKKALEKIKEGK